MSVLLSSKATDLTASVSWGDYVAFDAEEGHSRLWKRTGHAETVPIKLVLKDRWKTEIGVPNSRGLSILISLRKVPPSSGDGGIPAGTFSASLFLVNKRRLEIADPQWRPFQLAFVLMNLPGVVNPEHPDRETVDLLFFPTGGGKTEAYLGLAAFTLVFRRLKCPGISSAGLSVLMRYTLRLLTLDQLGRAAALICALELEREKDVEKFGKWPFEIGLWVGQAATPNVMGQKGDNNPRSARSKAIA